MKTLVIHPEDKTTDCLSVIYKDKDWTVINGNVSKKTLKDQIKAHERVIMLGHGSDKGLFGFSRFFIDSTFVYILRHKDCVCIWCNADIFVKKYGLSGFYTGMIISEVEEAYIYCVKASLEEITQSNLLFSDAIKQAIDSPTFLDDVKLLYDSETNPIIVFNKKNVYFSQKKEQPKNEFPKVSHFFFLNMDEEEIIVNLNDDISVDFDSEGTPIFFLEEKNGMIELTPVFK